MSPTITLKAIPDDTVENSALDNIWAIIGSCIAPAAMEAILAIRIAVAAELTFDTRLGWISFGLPIIYLILGSLY